MKSNTTTQNSTGNACDHTGLMLGIRFQHYMHRSCSAKHIGAMVETVTTREDDLRAAYFAGAHAHRAITEDNQQAHAVSGSEARPLPELAALFVLGVIAGMLVLMLALNLYDGAL